MIFYFKLVLVSRTCDGEKKILFANYHGLVPIRDLLTITCDFFSLVHLPCRSTLCHSFSMDCSPPRAAKPSTTQRTTMRSSKSIPCSATAGRHRWPANVWGGSKCQKTNDKFVWENMMMVCPKMTLFRGHMTWWLNHIRNWMSLYVLRIWKAWVRNLAESSEFDVPGKVVGAITFN